MKSDSLALGLILGLLGPLIGAVAFYFLQLTNVPFQVFIEQAVTSPRFTAPLLSFGAIVNLFIFFIFIWTGLARAARGVIFATFIYAIIIIVLKYVL